MSSRYSFQIYETIARLRVVEECLKFASEYRGFSHHRSAALQACYDQQKYLQEQFDSLVKEDKKDAQTKPPT